ncbi:glycosyltransferase [Mucilaginibacter pallidiroseus]|uniref:Glycosyltransferase n=1 Tax=Mucilaginibacter pallidiroseus TaxID=2599295 RepID=A0A563U8D1_9SPHI|nr:glycosyltransferase [Mucilaginibacter pallidiroseus]
MASNNIALDAIELFGSGSPYEFDTVDNSREWWRCLFPDNSSADLDGRTIKSELFKQLDVLKPDLVIGPSIAFYAGALGLAWAKANGRKFVMFDDAKPEQVKRSWLVQTIKNIITSQADAFWLPSPSYDEYHEKFRNDDTVVFYGFNCIDNDLFKPQNPQPSASKQIVCVARLVPIKNIESLLRAWQEVQNVSDYKLKIIGNGLEEGKLRRLKANLNLSSVVFTNTVDNENLATHLHNANAFVLPSLSETWGLVVNEAMAAGLPVLLSTHINAATDLLQEGENGYAFNPYDIQSITKAIIKFINLPDNEKGLMSERSVGIIDSMSYHHMGANLLKALKQLETSKFKKPGVVASALIRRWHGRYNTAGWDKL